MFDFCVNGGGMIGSAVALGLLEQGYRVALIETNMPKPFDSNQGPDLRVSAISMASIQLLEKLGAWQHVMAMRARSYSGLSVWEQPSSRTDFNAADIGEKQLGYFVENRILQLACHQALAKHENLSWINQGRMTQLEANQTGCQLVLSDGQTLQSHWVIGADGAQSMVRRLLNVGTSGWQYEQQALGITVKMTEPVEDRTWQQFFPSGPRAFLPMYGQFGSVVWYDSASRIKALKSLSKTQLHDEVVSHFPSELGQFEVVDCAAFPLTRQHASQYVLPGAVLIGDAAHTINPLAGQGVNLGFKDVESFLKVSESRIQFNQPNQFYATLKADFERPRQRDNLLMMSAMDGFYQLFSNENGMVSVLRNTALRLAQQAGPIKNTVLRYATGLSK